MTELRFAPFWYPAPSIQPDACRTATSLRMRCAYWHALNEAGRLIGGALGGWVLDLKLRGRVALVTGSSRGIGLATAKAFAAEGCRLMLSARSAEQLATAEAVLRTSG
ncbi:MAG TPA: SDR family NAD(P)-dependent oxidoreductase, partial [Variovorax sp.]